jgi:hypothetical protein
VIRKAAPRAVLAAWPLLFGLASMAEAQTGVVEGRVSDPAKGAYLEGVEVAVEGTTKSTRTDNTGWYRLSELPLGAVTVKVSYPGFVTMTREVRLEANAASRQEFELSNRIAGAGRHDNGSGLEASREGSAFLGGRNDGGLR